MSATVPPGVSLLARRYLRQHPRAAATHMETAAPEEVLQLLASEPTPQAAAATEHMASRAVADLLEEATPEYRRQIISAQSSSIFLTTVTDVVEFSSFLGIATLLSSML